MQKELRIMPRKDKPNVYLVLMTTGFICLLMMCEVERGAEAIRSCFGPLKAHSHGHCSAHLCNPRLREKNYQSVT